MFHSHATPLLLAIILAQANAYLQALTTLRLSGTILTTQLLFLFWCYQFMYSFLHDPAWVFFAAGKNFAPKLCFWCCGSCKAISAL